MARYFFTFKIFKKENFFHLFKIKILYELPTIGQWCFDLSWSRRNPNLVCASSFEGQVNIYSLMGGKYNVIQQTSSKIMDSFGDVPTTPPVVSQQQQITQQIQQLKSQ